MHHRAEYLLQVLEKIGSPLLASVIEVNARTDSSLQNEAQKIAELIAKTVQTSIDMSYALDLGPTGEMTDSIRVALTGLASPLVAGAYKNTGKAPGDNDIKRMITALQAVLTFAENFSADDENTGRLENIPATGEAADSAQAHVQYIHAFIPVVNAVSAFSFGMPEQKLIMDIASRLTHTATQMRQDLFGDQGAANKRIELAILRGAALLYAAAHEAETARIMTMNENQRAQQAPGGNAQMDALWQNFDMRLAILTALGQGLAGKSSGSGSNAPRPAQPEPAPVMQQPPQQFTPPPAATPQAVNPMAMFSKNPPANPAPPAQPQSPAGNNNNPMAFFKSPPKSDEQGGGGAF